MNFDHREILSVLDDLIKPISTVKISGNDEDEQRILTINLIFSNAYERFIESNPTLISRLTFDDNEPVVFRYMEIHLELLETLDEFENKNESSRPVFSVQDERILSHSLAVVILLGLILNFDQGICQSLETYFHRSSTFVHLKKLKHFLSIDDRMFYLNRTLNRLMKLIEVKDNGRVNFLCRRLTSEHLLEIIVGHFQLIYSPNLKYLNREICKRKLEENLEYFRKEMPTNLIENLMFLNNFLSKTIESPVWLRQRCGDLLTSLLLADDHHGIRRIFQTVLDSNAPNDRLYVSLARIVSTCPKKISIDDYIDFIRPELIELFRDRRYRPIISLTINQLDLKYGEIVENRLFAHLFQFSFDDEIIEETRWKSFLDDLDQLTEISSSDRIRRYFLKNHFQFLINFYLAADRSIFAVKENLFRILLQLFSSINVDETFEFFQTIFFHSERIPLKLFDDHQQLKLVVDRTIEIDPETSAKSICRILFAVEHRDRLIVRIFRNLLAKNPHSQQDFIMKVLQQLSDFFSEHVELIIENIDDTIQIVQIIFDQFQHDEDLLQISMTICSLFLTHYDQLSLENKEKLNGLYPSLRSIEGNHSRDDFRQLARELALAFRTFGAVKDQRENEAIPSKILIQEVDDQRDLREETYRNAFSCLYDASLPIRSHGLILFRRLIERSDEETLKEIERNQTSLFQRFHEHLNGDDSYEYLAAINVFSALATRYTDRILPILCDEYLNFNEHSRRREDQLKVGEILVKTSRLLGDMSSKYSSLLINTFLNASKENDDSLYRASALSNLGQICSILKYSLTRELAEILMALKNYLSIFESAEVRRASILVCQLLSQSLEKSSWLTILDDQLPSFYRLINQLYKNDHDDVVRLHAQIALESLNEICREFFHPTTTLEKSIRILS